MYIPGPDIDTQAAERVVESYNRAINRSGDQAVFVLGDLNACDITLLPNLHQNVTCPTRFNETIDLSFSNNPDAFQSLCRPPLGRSDHNVTHLVPEYRQKLKRETSGAHHVRLWVRDSSKALKGCFECTDWQVLFDGCSDNPDEFTDSVTSCIHFCEETIIQIKTVRFSPQ